MQSQSDSVINFYNGKSVLITGGTGSLGKILLEKLLRSCCGLKNVYLLVRPKKGQTAEQRLADVLNIPLFDKLKKESPESLRKITMIEGDLNTAGLGLTSTVKTTLIEHTSIVFHCAATVSFNETLKQAITINVYGTRALVRLCERMPKIEAFVHVSTFFSNCNKTVIEENIYPIIIHHQPIDNFTIDELVKRIPTELVEQWPNAYTFSKALAENYLNCVKHRIPISIVRPSIVLATDREPMSGWIDNIYGPTVILCNSAKGFLRTMICDREKIAHVIPSDVVVNLMICVASRTKDPLTNDVKVYNCCTGARNPLTWGNIADRYNHYTKLYPVNDIMWYPGTHYRTSHLINAFFTIVQHYLIAYVLDFLTWLKGGKPQMVRIQKSTSKIFRITQFFCTRQWAAVDTNSERLALQLNKEDRETFPCDVRHINWDKYIENYTKGIKQYLFKEKLDTVEAARARVRKFFWLEKVLQVFFTILLVYFLLSLF